MMVCNATEVVRVECRQRICKEITRDRAGKWWSGYFTVWRIKVWHIWLIFVYFFLLLFTTFYHFLWWTIIHKEIRYNLDVVTGGYAYACGCRYYCFHFANIKNIGRSNT